LLAVMAAGLNLSSHANYFLKCLQTLPHQYTSLDTNRLTVAYFCVAGLDVLGRLDALDAPRIIRWVYAQQVLPTAAGAPGGFRGGPFLGGEFCGRPANSSFDSGHIAMTYTALALLAMLGDDLSAVDRTAALALVSSLQDSSGAFSSTAGGESDMRFVFCAAAICTMLGDPGCSSIDVDAATSYILASQNYDGGIGLGPGMESHGGSIYTAVAALTLLGTLPRLPRANELVHWCIHRQLGGYQGRPNKDEDTCYSFWLGASLELLGAGGMSDRVAIGDFASRCEFKHGGIGKCAGNHPDVLHSYYALCGLSLAGWEGLSRLDARLGITRRASISAGWLPMPNADSACAECDEAQSHAMEDLSLCHASDVKVALEQPTAGYAPSSFIESSFRTKVEYERWVASGRALPSQ